MPHGFSAVASVGFIDPSDVQLVCKHDISKTFEIQVCNMAKFEYNRVFENSSEEFDIGDYMNLKI